MRTVIPWVGLIVLLVLAVFHPFGLRIAGWNEPITATDVIFFMLALYFAIQIEIRDLVKAIKG